MVSLKSYVHQVFPCKPEWTAEDIPDLSGKIFFITGANAGIGKETALELAKHGAEKIYIACRNKQKAEKAIQEIKESVPDLKTSLIFHELDLSSIKDIKESAKNFLKIETRLNVLINNAGVMNVPINDLTKDGYDMQFGVNVIGHYVLFKELSKILLNSATPTSPSRVVNLASSASWGSGPLKFNTFTDTPERKAMYSLSLYLQSKLGNVLLSNKIARLYGPNKGLISISLDPGNIKTDLFRYTSFITSAVVKLILHNVQLGALSTLYAATIDDSTAKNLNGKYLVPWARVGEPAELSKDEKTQDKLWDWLDEQYLKN